MATFDQLDLMRRLAPIPRNDPARCLIIDHGWSAWGPYVPEGLGPVQWDTSAENGPEPIKAWRRRGCLRCGCEQVENYDGTERKIVADPSGIEKRIKRRADG